VPPSTDVVPPELALGACIEVWAADGRSVFDAWRRHSRARHRWAQGSRMSTADLCRRVPAGAPWSVDFLLAHGGRDRLQQRLERAGVTLADLSALQEAALRWPVEDVPAAPTRPG
jgi:hypothetical protein